MLMEGLIGKITYYLNELGKFAFWVFSYFNTILFFQLSGLGKLRVFRILWRYLFASLSVDCKYVEWCVRFDLFTSPGLNLCFTDVGKEKWLPRVCTFSSWGRWLMFTCCCPLNLRAPWGISGHVVHGSAEDVGEKVASCFWNKLAINVSFSFPSVLNAFVKIRRSTAYFRACNTAYVVEEIFIFWLCLVTEALQQNGGGGPGPVPTADNCRSIGKVAIYVKESSLNFLKYMLYTSRTVYHSSFQRLLMIHFNNLLPSQIR